MRPLGVLPPFPMDIITEAIFQGDPVNVCVGTASYDPTKGFALSSSGDLGFSPTEKGIVLTTTTGHSLRLWTNRPLERPISALRGIQWFDVSLVGNEDLNRDVLVTKWKMPCNQILEHVEANPITPSFKHRTVTEVRARNRTLFRGKVRSFRAEIHLELAYEVRGQATGAHHLEPLASFVIEYRRPRSVAEVQEHEKALRGFLDFLWMKPHSIEYLLLWENDMLMRLNKTAVPKRDQTLLEKTLLYNEELVRTNLNSWLNEWIDLV